MPGQPLKLVSHNVLLDEADGGRVAFERAVDMGISMVRYDFRWRELDTGGGWAWDD
ncbi:MAG: hypothetical protein GWN18_17810, partial [Thermoplasmata archaeon]|nr:hypothetical protein [Thermoplasmata archaeon]NIS13981.1 hypothetical protein [Thermoplasmata archaeon]NIU50851.1 hypothetical protein [Thermoplasmata archaeon]NIW84374.1 hypothetical protein [Thermoplasmata archaeon]